MKTYLAWKNKKFKRSIFHCKNCGHYTNKHKYSDFMKKVYEKDYSKYSYGKVLEKFRSIQNLLNKNPQIFFDVNLLMKILKEKQ